MATLLIRQAQVQGPGGAQRSFGPPDPLEPPVARLGDGDSCLRNVLYNGKR